MLTLLIGNNKVGIRNFINGRRSNYKKDNIREFEKGTFTQGNIIDVVSGNSLFEGSRLFVLYPKNASEIDFSDDLLEQINDNNGIEIIIDVSSVLKTSAAYKKLKKHAKPIDFSEKPDYLYFNIADALYLEANVTKALDLLNTAENINNNFYLLVAAFNSSLRNLAVGLVKSKGYNLLHPFVRKKIDAALNNANRKNRSLDHEFFKKEYGRLFDLDVKLKSSSGDKKAVIKDFMLYST